MRHVHICPSLEKVRASVGSSILVGQRCLLSTSSAAARTASCTAYVVAECVLCEDASVVEEQVECLERVLPFGIDVLGVSGNAAAVAELTAQLYDVASKDWICVVGEDGPGKSRSAYLLGSPSTKVEVVETDVSFVEVCVALHSREQFLPLLVSSPGGSSAVIDGESDDPINECVPLFSSGAHVVQLGAAATTLRIHLVLAPAFISAQGIYRALRRQIDAAVAAGTTRLVEVQAHNAHISYCCRIQPSGAAADVELSPEVLKEVLEMIEDATGAAAQRCDVRGYANAAAGKGVAADTSAGRGPVAVVNGVPALRKKMGNEVLLLLGVVIVVIGVVVIAMQ